MTLSGCTKAYLSLGSNINNPCYQLLRAISSIDALPYTLCSRVSKFYRNPFIGDITQPDVINAVVALDTQLGVNELFLELQKIESQSGRMRNKQQVERVLDCDILLYGDEIIDNTTLIIPHPRMLERAFVMIPLSEIAPECTTPKGENILQLASKFSMKNFQVMDIGVQT